jgi:hypothetical protein
MTRRCAPRSGAQAAAPALLGAVTLTLAACGATHLAPSSATRSAPAVPPAPASVAAPVRLRVAVRAAQRAYKRETRGSKLQQETARIAQDPLLLSALARGDAARAQAAAHAQLLSPSNHFDHVTRISVTRGGHVLANATLNHDGTFVVAPARRALVAHGREIGTLMVSIQDVTGFVRLVHRSTLTEVVARGSSGQVRTSLRAAYHVRLPASGATTIAGHGYLVRSFHELGWGGERLTVWILASV